MMLHYYRHNLTTPEGSGAGAAAPYWLRENQQRIYQRYIKFDSKATLNIHTGTFEMQIHDGSRDPAAPPNLLTEAKRNIVLLTRKLTSYSSSNQAFSRALKTNSKKQGGTTGLQQLHTIVLELLKFGNYFANTLK